MTTWTTHRPTRDNRIRFRAMAFFGAVTLVTGMIGLVPSSAEAAGATYYVAQGGGCSDSASGTSSASAFCTIKAATKKATSGDTITVDAGDYHEQVEPAAGVTVMTIVGATINATDPATVSGTADVTRSYGIKLASDSVADGFNVREAGVADVVVAGANGATVRNVQVSGSKGYGIYVSGGSGNTVTGVRSAGNASVGVLLRDTTGSSVLDSTASNNNNHGISVQGGSHNRVAGVTAFNNTSVGTPRIASGIDVNKSALGPSLDTLIERNTTYGNADSGIEIYNGSSGAVVRRNLTYDNGDHGIDVSKAPNATVTSNTVLRNTNPGLNVEGGSTGVSVRDNIAADNATASTGLHGDIRVDQFSTSGTTLDHDLVFRSSGTGTVIEWNTVDYKTLAAFKSAQPQQEVHGLSGDPRLNSSFVPDDGSPALDSADSGAPGWLAMDRAGQDPFDQPSVADTGAGPTPYADRGALERTTSTTPPPPPPVDNAPTAALIVTPAQPKTGDPVVLDASTSTDDQAVTGYAFSCGNGHTVASGTNSSTTCTYTTAGTYTASVTVKDAAGHTDTASKPVTVTAPPPPPPPTREIRADLSVDHGTTRQMTPVLLNAAGSTPSTGAHITSYKFSCGMGDAHLATMSSTMRCIYRNIGTYVASVVVADSAGQTARATATVRVLRGASPMARLVLSRHSIRSGHSVRATSRSTGSTGLPIVRTRISCGGHQRTFTGTTRATMRCTFHRPGRHTVRLVVWNSLGYWSRQTAYVWVRRHR